MIKLYDAAITDGVPQLLASQPWVVALAYALRIQMRKLLDLADASRSYAVVDVLGDKLLNVLAVELRVPQYSASYSLTVKRALVKNAINYWAHAGTRAAVEDLCQGIFGDADILEWFEYGGAPGYFKISTSANARLDEFRAAVGSIKRLSQWLDEIELIDAVTLNHYCGFYLAVSSTEIYEMEAGA